MNTEIIILTEDHPLLEDGIHYIWKCWGSSSNFRFYKDCILHSLSTGVKLPKFYLLLEKSQIIGCYALLTNDIISRQDLMPWFACLFVDEAYRGKGLAKLLLSHGLNEAEQAGFEKLYLSTDLDDFYENAGWSFYATGYGVGGDAFKIYEKATI